jgi:PleD family two-component response regulator
MAEMSASKATGSAKGRPLLVQLPIVAVYSESEEERCHPPAALDENRSLPEEVSLTNVDVLVVDDEIDARNLVKRLLEMAGVTVSRAASSSEAMERILARRPDALVCDIGMPGEDGYSLIRRLRAIEKVQENALPAVSAERIRPIGGSREIYPCWFSE